MRLIRSDRWIVRLYDKIYGNMYYAVPDGQGHLWSTGARIPNYSREFILENYSLHYLIIFRCT